MEEDKTKVQAPLQPAKPDPALRRLDILVGKWELRGRTLDTAEDSITGWVNFEWLPGGFFLEARGEIDFRGNKVQSLEILAYDPETDTFPANVYSNIDGNVMKYYWDIKGNTVTHWTEGAEYTGTVSEDGKTLSGGWRPQTGTEGSPESTYDAVMTRVNWKEQP
ncbi:MAG TPA: DUF1579 family protein [Anaerolineales bacterium]|nr:DUF1579 family protein [Anaerolineales bacterium]